MTEAESSCPIPESVCSVAKVDCDAAFDAAFDADENDSGDDADRV